jgi:enoyl-CoA hydratase/carnithine racemase
MGALVTCRLQDSVTTITMDDGKVNVLSMAMLTELGAALDRAAADRAVVVLTGREGVFSAGLDLPVLRAGGTEAADLLRTGFDVAARLLLTANEVAIGMTVPQAAVEICRQRLTPACFNRAVVIAEVFSPEDAVDAGFLDRVVPAGELARTAAGAAAELAKLDLDAHEATKLRARRLAVTALREAIETGDAANRERLAAQSAGY